VSTRLRPNLGSKFTDEFMEPGILVTPAVLLGIRRFEIVIEM
jgi:hypothetical protein